MSKKKLMQAIKTPLQSYTVTGTKTEQVTVEITNYQLSGAIMREVKSRIPIDDGDMDWFTDLENNVYVGSKEWKVASEDKILATLVDAQNILVLGYRLDAADYPDVI
jgi:hypothetical protein